MNDGSPAGSSATACPRSSQTGWDAGCPIIIGLALVTIIAAVYYPALSCQFVDLDDPIYVSSNPHLQGGWNVQKLAWAFQAGYASNWHPLTWLSHLLDLRLYGLNPAGHHLTNLILHALNSVLLFLLLRRMTRAQWRSAMVAALFALHPLHVESIAWVSERKDVLSGFFFLLTLMAYARYAAVKTRESGLSTGQAWPAGDPEQSAMGSRGSVRGRSLRYYLRALILFALGLMSKPMLVTTPFVLLLLDYWPLNRFQVGGRTSKLGAFVALVLEKLPFIALSGASCYVTMVVQKEAMQPLTNVSITGRLANALVAYLRYLGKTFWPFDLATPYPYPSQWPVLAVLMTAVLLAAICAVALVLRRQSPFLATGWFWYLGMLVPVIGLVQVGEQSMADRYTYLPLIGIFIILTWGAAQICSLAGGPAGTLIKTGSQRWVFAVLAAGLVLFPLAARTRDQLQHWRNGESLSRHAIAVTENNWIAYFDLGSNLDARGLIDEAMTNYSKALVLQPQYPDPLNNIGCILANRRQFAQAVPYFEAALRSSPNFANAHDNLAHLLCELGRFSDAIPHFQAVLKANPDDKVASDSLAGAHFNAGKALAAQGRTNEAAEHFVEALRLQPNLTPAKQALERWPGGAKE
jgi:protein O-mannosyl-transferase